MPYAVAIHDAFMMAAIRQLLMILLLQPRFAIAVDISVDAMRAFERQRY